MEEAKFLEKHEFLLTDKMKSASSHDKIKELVSPEPSDSPSLSPDKISKREEVIPKVEQEIEVEKSAEKPQEKLDSLREKPISEASLSLTSLGKDSRKWDDDGAVKEVSEAKEEPILSRDISLASVPRESKQEHKVNEPVSDNTIKPEMTLMAIHQEEPNPQKKPTEECLKSRAEAEGAQESAAAKEEKSEVSIDTAEYPRLDHQMTGETSKEAAKKLVIKKAIAMVPEEKMRKDMQEYIDGIQAREEKKRLSDEIEAREAEAILVEEERRRYWKSLLLEVSQATLLSTTNSSLERSSTPRSVVVAILQRSAKQQYKKKMGILRENYTYRLGLLKQLKHDMKNNFRSEAQQLYFQYHSAKNKTQNTRHIDTTDMRLDSKESKLIVTSENPKDLATLG